MTAGVRVMTFFSRNWKYILLALLMYMPLFGKLDTLPIRDYDEARITINAYEMYKDGDWIVTHYMGDPEMWNTKPPFLMWTQVMFTKMIGFNEIAMRLPSAFAGFFTCLALLIFCIRYLRNEWLGIITVISLITTNGYVHYHVTRTGDFDALLTLFTTVSCLSFFAYCENLNLRFLYLFFFALALGCLTKGIAALLFAPALFAHALMQKRVFSLLKNQHFYAGIAMFLVLVLGYYLLRESRNPGYLEQVQINELGGRYLESQGNQTHTFWFYYEKLTEFQVADRFLLIPVGIIFGLLSRDPRLKKFTLFATILSVTFFLIVSGGKTRMEQYIAPLFPFFAWFVAVVIDQVFQWLRQLSWNQDRIRKNILPYLFLFFVIYSPYRMIWAKTYTPAESYYWDVAYYELPNFFKKALRGKYDLNGTKVIFGGYNAHILFYIYALNEKGVDIHYTNPSEIREGENIITYQEELKQYIRDNFNSTENKISGAVSVFSVTTRREAGEPVQQ